jgi:hypothetical protein
LLFEFCSHRLASYSAPSSEGYVIVRGGSFRDTTVSARCACRGGAKLDERDEDYGLRPARKLVE